MKWLSPSHLYTQDGCDVASSAKRAHLEAGGVAAVVRLQPSIRTKDGCPVCVAASHRPEGCGCTVASSANLVCGAPTHYLESTAFGAMISVPHWTFFVVERIKESFCSGRQLHHSPLLQSAVYIQVLLLSV